MQKLPIGLSTLEKIRGDNYVYIDKTHHIVNLYNSGGRYYFLSRPRRFGKSLLLDTLKQAFLGNKQLFSGLYLEPNWDWNKTYPVLHFDFGGSSAIAERETLLNIIWTTLENYGKLYQISIRRDLNYGLAFQELIRAIVEKLGVQVVVLIDEYDKPILDNISNISQAALMHEMLKDLYVYIKTNDAYIKFALLTGVSKFSKVSLFSGLNILDDISLDRRYADICGYTQSELESAFAEYLAEGMVDKGELKRWYNGYNFAGAEEQKVYNPFDILLFFSKNYEYRSYWFETATPTFLIKLIQENSYYFPDLESLIVNPEELSDFDVDNIPITTLLFQTGYLTVKSAFHEVDGLNYELSYPNFEVKTSLNRHLAALGDNNSFRNRRQLLTALQQSNFDAVKAIFSSHFASIPHDWYRNNNIAQYEGFYASVVYSYLASLGYDLIAEDVTNIGKIDLTLKMPDKIILLEFKLSKYGTAMEALAQIRAKGYAEKYLAEEKPIYLLGLSFALESRNVSDFACEIF